MIIAGTISKEGRYWCVTLPALDGTTQGKTRKEALLMAADYVESLLEPQRRSKVTARYIGDVIEVECRDDAALMAHSSCVASARRMESACRRYPNASAKLHKTLMRALKMALVLLRSPSLYSLWLQ